LCERVGLDDQQVARQAIDQVNVEAEAVQSFIQVHFKA
jgi:hypothetical protein